MLEMHQNFGSRNISAENGVFSIFADREKGAEDARDFTDFS